MKATILTVIFSCSLLAQRAATKTVEAIYPPSALMKGIEDEVTLDLIISQEGTVVKIRNIVAGRLIFIDAAIKNIMQWKFEAKPGLGSEQMQLTYHFVLQSEEAKMSYDQEHHLVIVTGVGKASARKASKR